MKIGIIGIGLMGGSFALDFRSKNKNSKIYGFDTNKKSLDYSIENKIVDELLSEKNCRDLDFLIISVPVHNIPSTLKKYLKFVSQNTLLVDLGSTKKSICDALKNHPKRDQFLATHPIAGTENSGPRSVVSGLYINSINIIAAIYSKCHISKSKKKTAVIIKYVATTSNIILKILYIISIIY